MFIGYYNIANAITLLGLISSVCACFNAVKGDFRLAVILMVSAGICDMFDGVVARSLKRSEDSKIFGVQIDTVCDMVSFGVTPAILLFCMGFSNIVSCIALSLLVACAGIRLAYFNTLVISSGKSSDTYVGLPVPFSAMILPPVLLLKNILSEKAYAVLTVIVVFAIAFAFISKFRITKLHGKIYIFYAAYALALIILYVFFGGVLNG